MGPPLDRRPLIAVHVEPVTSLPEFALQIQSLALRAPLGPRSKWNPESLDVSTGSAKLQGGVRLAGHLDRIDDHKTVYPSLPPRDEVGARERNADEWQGSPAQTPKDADSEGRQQRRRAQNGKRREVIQSSSLAVFRIGANQGDGQMQPKVRARGAVKCGPRYPKLLDSEEVGNDRRRHHRFDVPGLVDAEFWGF